jgi:DNA-binding CsgD family transcriptional regulator
MRARNRLTTQELEIIAHVVQGHKNREIAVRMGSTEPSVKNMLRRIFDKTGVYGRLELALYVLHHGMLGKFPQPGYASSHRVPISAAIEQWNVGRRPTVN